jgi:hypothetical protein
VSSLDDRQVALVGLGQALRAEGYRFVTPTPRTHALVNARPENLAAHSGATSTRKVCAADARADRRKANRAGPH